MINLLKMIFSSSSPSPDLRSIIYKGALLVDVRNPEELAGGAVKGAINIPLDKVSTSIEKFKGHDHIVVFCRSGNRSGKAKTILNEHGISNVINGGSWENVNQYLDKSE